MNIRGLEKRIRELEALFKGENVEITFMDGTVLAITEKQWLDLWDPDTIRMNPIYLRFLKEYEKGNPDSDGLIHLMNAYAVDMEELWADESCTN